MAGEVGYSCTLYIQPNTLTNITLSYSIAVAGSQSDPLNYTRTIDDFVVDGDYLKYVFTEEECNAYYPYAITVESTGYLTASGDWFAFGIDSYYLTLEADPNYLPEIDNGDEEVTEEPITDPEEPIDMGIISTKILHIYEELQKIKTLINSKGVAKGVSVSDNIDEYYPALDILLYTEATDSDTSLDDLFG